MSLSETGTAGLLAWPRRAVKPLACRKAKELGYPHELWTTRLLAAHMREHGPREGHDCLGKLAQGTLCIILNAQEIKPHKVRYYLAGDCDDRAGPAARAWQTPDLRPRS